MNLKEKADFIGCASYFVSYLQILPTLEGATNIGKDFK